MARDPRNLEENERAQLAQLQREAADVGAYNTSYRPQSVSDYMKRESEKSAAARRAHMDNQPVRSTISDAERASASALLNSPRVGEPVLRQHDVSNIPVERSRGLARKSGALGFGARTGASPEPASSPQPDNLSVPTADATFPPRPLAQQHRRGVFTNEAVIDGVRQNVYSDSAFDPLFRGAKTRNEAVALARRDPEFAQQYAQYGADRDVEMQKMEAADAARQAQELELLLTKFSGDRAPTPETRALDAAKAKREAAAIGKDAAEAQRIQAQGQLFSTQAQELANAPEREANKEFAKTVDALTAAKAQEYAENPQAIRARWGGGINADEAAALDAMQYMIQSQRNPLKTDVGHRGVAALSKLLKHAAQSRSLLDRVWSGDDWIPEVEPNAGVSDPGQISVMPARGRFRQWQGRVSGDPYFEASLDGSTPITLDPDQFGSQIDYPQLDAMLSYFNRLKEAGAQ